MPRAIRLGATVLVLGLLVQAGFAQVPEPGKMAPKFTGVDQDGRSVSYPPAGAWSILAFYPKSATPG